MLLHKRSLQPDPMHRSEEKTPHHKQRKHSNKDPVQPKINKDIKKKKKQRKGATGTVS